MALQNLSTLSPHGFSLSFLGGKGIKENPSSIIVYPFFHLLVRIVEDMHAWIEKDIRRTTGSILISIIIFFMLFACLTSLCGFSVSLPCTVIRQFEDLCRPMLMEVKIQNNLDLSLFMKEKKVLLESSAEMLI